MAAVQQNPYNVVTDRAKVHFPADLGRAMNAIIPFLPSPGLEYGIYMKGEWVPEELAVRIRPGEFYFPKQVVSSATIKFLEDPPDNSWNCVMHRHPPGVRSFSGVDRDSINLEFLASLLFLPLWDYPMAVVNIPIARGRKIQVQADIVVDGELFEGSDELRRQVKEKLSLHQPVAPRTVGERTVVAGGGTATLLGNAPSSFPNVPGTGSVGQLRGGTLGRIGRMNRAPVPPGQTDPDGFYDASLQGDPEDIDYILRDTMVRGGVKGLGGILGIDD